MQHIKKLLSMLLLSVSMAAMASAPTPGSVKWTFNVQGKVDAGLAVGADGTVYVPSEDLHLWAVNPDGTKKWAFPVLYPIAGSPVLDNSGNIIVEGRTLTMNQNGIYSIKPDGTQNWMRTLPVRCDPDDAVASSLGFMTFSSAQNAIGVTSVELCHADNYYAQIGIHVLNAEPGKGSLGWYEALHLVDAYVPGAPNIATLQANLRAPFFVPQIGSRVVMTPLLKYDANWNPKSTGLFSVNMSTYEEGATLTGQPDETHVFSPISNLGGAFFVSDSLGDLIAYDLGGADGTQATVRWRIKLGGDLSSAAPTTDILNRINVVSSNGYLYCVATDGTINWTLFIDKSGLSRSAAEGKDGSLYVTANNGNVYAVTPKGKMKWSQPVQVNASTAPVVGPDGTVYVGTDLGTVVAINP